jgi:glyoxylase-like metal-dependent hydrolase (beta-lactamase superfamily II)
VSPAPIPFVTLTDPRYGEVVRVAPLVRRVVAENPSKFTYHGTGTYLVGDGDHVAVIDPGPIHDGHREALMAALAGQRVSAILVTHCHADHSPLATWLAAETGAPTVAFGPHPRLDDPDADDPVTGDDTPADGTTGDVPESGQSGEPGESGESGEPGEAAARIEESTDYDFDPQVRVADGDIAASGPGYTLRAVHTPGHTSNHLCFSFDEQRSLFTGDHIMGWSTTVIGPPDGDMGAYFQSLQKVLGRGDHVFLPTHGAPITDTRPFLEAFIAHRLDREAQVLGAVRSGQSNIAEMVKQLYAGVREELHKPAGRSVLAHLIKLVADGEVVTDGDARPTLKAAYRPV